MTDQQRADQALTQVEHALRACGLLDFSGEVQLLEWSKSTSRDGPKVKFMLQSDDDVVPFETATTKKGKQAGQLYRVFAVRIDLDTPSGEPHIQRPGGEGGAAPAESPASTCPTCGDPASLHYGNVLPYQGGRCPPKMTDFLRDLHARNYWFNPRLWEAMEAAGYYTRTMHNEWIKGLSCCVNQIRRPHHVLACAGDVCGHHTPSAALPAGGAGQKHPNKVSDFNQVPLCHTHHTVWAHGSGAESATREEKQKLVELGVRLTGEQMRVKMREALCIPTMRFLTQAMLDDFERHLGLQ